MSNRGDMGRIPNIQQRRVLDLVTGLVNMILDTWPTRSGKTWLREELCRQIMEDDVNRREDVNPFLH